MLIKSSQIFNYKIVDVAGEDVGKVQDVVYDPGERKIAALVVTADPLFPAKVITFDKIRKINSGEVTISSKDDLADATQVFQPTTSQSQEVNDNTLKNNKVITTNGDNLGSIRDVLFDTSSGQVKEFIVDGAHSGQKSVNVNDIQVVGADIVVVDKDTSPNTESSGKTIFASDNKKDSKEKEASGKDEGVLDTISRKADKAIEDWKDNIQSSNESLQKKDKKTVVGKYLTKNILTDQDKIIGKRGDMITNKMVEDAQQENLLQQLVDNSNKKSVEN